MKATLDARSPTTAWMSAMSGMSASPPLPEEDSRPCSRLSSSAGARASPVTLISSRSPPTSPSPLPVPDSDDDRGGSARCAAASWCACEHEKAVGGLDGGVCGTHDRKATATEWTATGSAGAWTGAMDPPTPPAAAAATAPPPLAAACGTLALRVDQQAYDYALRDAQARFEETRRLAAENASLHQQLTRQRTEYEVELANAAALASQLEADLALAREGGAKAMRRLDPESIP